MKDLTGRTFLTESPGEGQFPNVELNVIILVYVFSKLLFLDVAPSCLSRNGENFIGRSGSSAKCVQ